jgi:hypothetical protein
MNGLDMMRGFIARGYTPTQAAALAGHALQESGGDPTNVNQAEGAHGLLQWRNDRWQGLQDFAKSQGKDPNDPEVQMDFVGREMSGPEAKGSAAFRNSTDVASASAALKPYIRFGDNSAGTRLNNSVGLLNQYNGGNAPPAAGAAPQDPVSPIDPTSTGSPPLSLSAPVGALATPAPTTGQVLQDLGSKLAPSGGGNSAPAQPDYLAPQQIAMPQANVGQSQQIAQALAKSYGWT